MPLSAETLMQEGKDEDIATLTEIYTRLYFITTFITPTDDALGPLMKQTKKDLTKLRKQHKNLKAPTAYVFTTGTDADQRNMLSTILPALETVINPASRSGDDYAALVTETMLTLRKYILHKIEEAQTSFDMMLALARITRV